MSEKQTVVAPLLCDLTDELGDRFFHHLCIGAKRDALMLSTAKPLSVIAGRSRDKMQFRLHHWHHEELHEFDLPPTPQVYYYAQKLGNNYLCVAARCAPGEKNAHIFSTTGDLIRSFHVGDGINDVQTAPSGQIWISYFDEGVCGDTEHSPQGLTCFSEFETQRVFGFASDAENSHAPGSIIDCYALNVASNRDTWLCYYTDFPLVHLRDFKIKDVFLPPPEMIGSHAFAVCDWRRLFAGGYHFNNQLFWRDEASKRQIEAVDENGDAITGKRAHGRGADLFLCDVARVHILSLNEIGF